jgi:hypothetical protein
MLAMFSPVEIFVAIGVTLITLPIVAGVGVIVYMIVRRAARDGARDAAKTAGPERSK